MPPDRIAAKAPAATYRLQLGPAFGFAAAAATAGYLESLGVSHVYLSPVLRARASSTHGYDVTHPDRLDPRLGSPRAFDLLAARIASAGMGLLLDIVPNHMAASPENPWWWDLLARGPASSHAATFDIDWQHRAPLGTSRGRILLPVLGRPYGEVVDAGEPAPLLSDRGFVLQLGGLVLPLATPSWSLLLRWAAARGAGGAPARRLASLARSCERSPETALPRLLGLLDGDREARRLLAGIAGRRAGRARLPAERIHELLRRQHYRLAWWRLASALVNYRRFFDINDLAGLRVEVPRVFDRTHAFVIGLWRQGKISGLRIDHIDGLFDPEGYLERLHRALEGGPGSGRRGTGPWVLVEKILSPDERLPPGWKAEGTTGYDFTRALAGLFVDPGGLARLDRFYSRFTGDTVSFEERVYHQKKRVIHDLFQAEHNRLARIVAALAAADRHACDILPVQIRRALVEVGASLDVYRTYLREETAGSGDVRRIHAAVRRARSRAPGVRREAFDLVERLLTGRAPRGSPASLRKEWRRAAMRWQQITGPVMAKGLEDTALYQYPRLLSLNQVGGEPDPDPGTFGPSAFHRLCRERRRHWPRTMNSTSTHDSKRGEDLRARLHVLSELPERWERAARRWHRMNRRWRTARGRAESPDRREELFIYQTLLGAWPADGRPGRDFAERIRGYVEKAAREAKLRTSWLDPDRGHEAALERFVRALLDRRRSRRFLEDLDRMAGTLAPAGAVNSLAQLVLKCAAPGVPDFYQGTERWSLTLVDPDNRRPVDFRGLGRALDGIRAGWERGAAALTGRLLDEWRGGRVKQLATWRCLAIRRSDPDLFAKGACIALGTAGPRSAHLWAMARRLGRRWIVCIVPMRIADALRPGSLRFRRGVWKGTAVRLPTGAPALWTSAFTGRELRAGPRAALDAGGVLSDFPVALLEGR